MWDRVPGKPCRVQLPNPMIYGRIQRTLRWEDVTLKPAPARKRRFEPFNVHSDRLQAAAAEAQTDGYDGGDDHDDERGGMQFPVAMQKRRRGRNTTEEEKRRLHEQWDASMADNLVRNTCWQAKREQRNTTTAEKLRTEFSTAVLANLTSCPSCGCAHEAHGFETLELVHRNLDQNHIIYVTTDGRVRVPVPEYRCSHCGVREMVHPIMAGAFPATPSQPVVYYAIRLLALTHELCLAAPLRQKMPCVARCSTSISGTGALRGKSAANTASGATWAWLLISGGASSGALRT